MCRRLMPSPRRLLMRRRMPGQLWRSLKRCIAALQSPRRELKLGRQSRSSLHRSPSPCKNDQLLDRHNPHCRWLPLRSRCISLPEWQTFRQSQQEHLQHRQRQPVLQQRQHLQCPPRWQFQQLPQRQLLLRDQCRQCRHIQLQFPLQQHRQWLRQHLPRHQHQHQRRLYAHQVCQHKHRQQFRRSCPTQRRNPTVRRPLTGRCPRRCRLVCRLCRPPH
mmetsp:Transcript_63554/g.169766  ORF Transcript_63554/g.169766 Transcript_63554/m.169766 type:complete len:218 (+) Transcript_63554:349-1002(+)